MPPVLILKVKVTTTIYKGDTMNSYYADLVTTYTRLMRSYSPSAAAMVELIQANYGAYAAYYSAFALTLFKSKLEADGCAPRMTTYSEFCYGDLLSNHPEAFVLFRRALETFVREWNEYCLKSPSREASAAAH